MSVGEGAVKVGGEVETADFEGRVRGSREVGFEAGLVEGLIRSLAEQEVGSRGMLAYRKEEL